MSRAARDWAQDTETCLHTKLTALLKRYPAPHPDPQLCLNWEMDAIAELNSCYTELGAAFLQLADAEIRTLVSQFRISNYYSPVVDDALVDLIRTRSEDLATEVMQSHTLSSRHRIILCIKATKYLSETEERIPSPQEYVAITSNELAPEEIDFFHYAGPDQLADAEKVGGLCYDRSQDFDVALNNPYHLVTWFTTEHSNQDIQRVDIQHRTNALTANAVMFELTSTESGNPIADRVVTQCGDGIRQVTESCDFTGSYPSCTIDCEVREGHDCLTDKLAPSRCWKEACGNGLRTRGEQCDDGNTLGLDGCSSSCEIEDNHKCSQRYNATSHCTPLNSRQALPQAAPARLVAGSVASMDLSSKKDTSERTVSSGYRLTSMLPITLSMAGISMLSLR